MTETKYKFDIFQILERFSVKDIEYFNNLSDEDLKSIQPLVIMRWMSGTNSAMQVYFLNELVNPFVFSLGNKHKRLLIELLLVCGSGKRTRFQWNKAASKKTAAAPKSIGVIKEYFGYNSRQATEAMPLLSNEDIMAYAEYLGRQPDELKIISKEIKNRGLID